MRDLLLRTLVLSCGVHFAFMAYAMTSPPTPSLHHALQNKRIASLIVARFEPPTRWPEPEVRQAPEPARAKPRMKPEPAPQRKARRPKRRPPAQPRVAEPVTPKPVAPAPQQDPVVLTVRASAEAPAPRRLVPSSDARAEAPEGPSEVPAPAAAPTPAEAPPSVASAEYEPGPDVEGLRVAYLGRLNTFFRRAHRYPRRARRAGLEGTVLLELVLDATGRILSIQIARSSGHSLLDDAAKSAVAQLRSVPRPPGELAWEPQRVRIPFHYSLRG